MKILISGSSGLIGTALARALQQEGHRVGRLLRSDSPAARSAVNPEDVRWNPASGQIDLGGLEGADGVVNLAGASIGTARWTLARKDLLRASRVDATRRLAESFARLRHPPKVFLSASAVGYYGNRGDEPLGETAAPGEDFLARLARDWEEAAKRAERAGTRTVILRFGVVLAAHGGALTRMLFPFRMGLGGRLGSGKQWMSWITLEDAVGVIEEGLVRAELSGPVNTVAPHPVRNAEFTRTLARVLRRPALFPVPEFALRALLGEMADALLLSSQNAIPQRLQNLGYSFHDPQLEPALRAVLKRP